MAIVIHSYILTALTQLLCMRLLCRIKHGIESMFIVVVRTVNMCQSNPMFVYYKVEEALFDKV
jgi:hypothetical protein